MKTMRKIACLSLVIALIASLAIPALAADTGSITIESSKTVTVNGRVLEAYKLLDLTKTADGKGFSYTVPDYMENFYKDDATWGWTAGTVAAELQTKTLDQFVQDTLGAMQSDSAELYAFAEKALDYVKANAVPAAATVTGANGEAVFSNLPLGYYLIDDTTVADATTVASALVLKTPGENALVTLKASQPPVDKNIRGEEDTDPATKTVVKYNNTSFGDVVPYVITSEVPDMIGYNQYQYIFTDTMSKGLTYNKDLEVTIGGAAMTVDTDYTVTETSNADGSTTIVVTFVDFINKRGLKGQEVQLTYSATINADAAIGIVGNPNAVTLRYSNDPEDGGAGGPDEVLGETPEVETRTFVSEIELQKYYLNGTEKVDLTGAMFKIEGTRANIVQVIGQEYVQDDAGEYWKLKDGSYTKTAPVTNVTDNQYDSITTMYSLVALDKLMYTQGSTPVSAEGFVDANGNIKFVGLGAGEYTITELISPAGFNLLKEPLKVVISFTEPQPATATTAAVDAKWTATVDGNDATVNDGTIYVEVENKSGTELPETGGMGTTILYILGTVLMLGAAVVLVSKRRMNA